MQTRYYVVGHREGDPGDTFWLHRNGRWHVFTWDKATWTFQYDVRSTAGSGTVVHFETRAFEGAQIAAFERVMLDHHLNDCRTGVDWLEPRARRATPPPGPRKPVPEGFIDLMQAVNLMTEHANQRRLWTWATGMPYAHALKRFALEGKLNWARYDGSAKPDSVLSFYVNREHVLHYCFRGRFAGKGEHKLDILLRADFLCETSGTPVAVDAIEDGCTCCSICHTVLPIRMAHPGRTPFHVRRSTDTA